MATRSDAHAAPATGARGVRLELGDPRWARFVAGHPEALAYHRPAWAGVLQACYGFEPFVLALLAGDEVVAGLPVVEVRRLRRARWAALPFTDVCPPLLGPRVGAGAFGAALDAARLEAGVELQVRAALAGAGAAERAVAVTHTLSLPPPGPRLSEVHDSHRRSVRRAAREGVAVRVADRADDLVRTYYGLHCQTRRRLGVPVQPRRFFAVLWERLLAPGDGRLLLAEVGSRPIAGIVLLTGGQTVTYKFGASDAGAWPLRPNHALFAEAIEWARGEGYARFDFGRSDLGDDGLRQFKSRWGAVEEPLVHATLGGAPAAAGGGRLLRAAGPAFRHAPDWVGRAAGTLLYRFAA